LIEFDQPLQRETLLRETRGIAVGSLPRRVQSVPSTPKAVPGLALQHLRAASTAKAVEL